VFGQAREHPALQRLAQTALIAAAVGACRDLPGLQDLQSVRAGAVPRAGQAGAARSFERPCALCEAGRKRAGELPL